MLTIATVYRPSRVYTDEYVYRLRDAFAEHLQAPHRFVCLTNEKLASIERLPLISRWPGYWNKLELFRYRPWYFDGPIFYCDLDMMIVGDVTDICTREYKFAAFRGRHQCGVQGLASDMMAWHGQDDFSYLYDSFDARLIPRYPAGDQQFIGEHLRCDFECLTDVWPGRVTTMGDIYRNGLGPATIVMCHSNFPSGWYGWKIPQSILDRRPLAVDARE